MTSTLQNAAKARRIAKSAARALALETVSADLHALTFLSRHEHHPAAICPDRSLREWARPKSVAARARGRRATMPPRP